MKKELKTIQPKESASYLEYFFAIEKELMRLQGARLPELESWSLKQRIGSFLYEDALHAQTLRVRRRELRAGARQFRTLDGDLRVVLEQILFAEGDYLFCSALYSGFKPLLVHAYRIFLEGSTTYSEIPSRQALEAIIAEEERQIVWMEGAMELMPGIDASLKKAGMEWVQNVTGWIEAGGGILGEGKRAPERLPKPKPYEVSKKARREPRQKATFSFETPVGEEDDYKSALLTQFTAYFREMAAAETMAGVLWEAPESMPWEFFMDSARHCWDEIRHCQVGQQRLEELGLNIWEVPVQTGHYDTRAHMPLLERYAFLTQVQEAESFKIKRENEAKFWQAGDALSANMVAYDMADERNHVRFGSKWIPELQKHFKDNRSIDHLVEDSRKLQAETWRKLSGGYDAHPHGQY